MKYKEKTSRCYYNSYKEIFEDLVEERFDEIKELTDEVNHDDLTSF